MPSIAGLVRAVVDPTAVDRSIPKRAVLNASGCYWLKFPFDTRTDGQDRTTLGQGKWSAPVRMLTGYGGPLGDFGSPTGGFFSLLPGTEVMVGFVGGDPDRPVIVGPAYDARGTSVVVGPSPISGSASAAQNVIRTPSGVVLKIFDGPAPTGSGESGAA